MAPWPPSAPTASNDPALCAQACPQLGPCIGPDDDGAALRDADICLYYCAISPDVPTPVWQCIAEQRACEGVYGCFGG
ncbi:MAG: hypothetical protein R3F43_21905 [bacterium]